MSAPNTAEAMPRLAYRAREVAEATGLTDDTIRRLCARGVIPTLGNVGDKVVLVPAWALHGWAATGRWDHPDWRPTPPVSAAADEGGATVTPIRPDAS